MPTVIAEENTQAIAQNTQAIADLLYALQVEVARARAAETAAGVYTDDSIATVNAAISALDTTLRAYIDSRSAAGMHYKGSVETTSMLPMTGNAAGDMYNVNSTGRNYVWDAVGNRWDDCGGPVDTTGLTEWSVFKAHRDNSVIHVTEADRARWNAPVGFAVGSVTRLGYGANPTVRNVGTDKDIILNFGIPAGKPFTYSDFTAAQLESLRGPTGPAPYISIGSVTPGESESDAHVAVTSQSDGNVTLSFTLPKGPKGDRFQYSDFTQSELESLRGPAGAAVKSIIIDNVSTLNPNQAARVEIASESPSEVHLDIRIPRGYSPVVYASAHSLGYGESAEVDVTSNQSSGGSSSVNMDFGIPQGDPGYIALEDAGLISTDVYQLFDDTANLLRVTGGTESVTLTLPYEYRSTSRTVGAHEFTVVFAFDSGWTGSTFNASWRLSNSSSSAVLHLFSASALDFSTAVPGSVIVVHFAEMWNDTSTGQYGGVPHYMVSSKMLTDVVEVTGS